MENGREHITITRKDRIVSALFLLWEMSISREIFYFLSMFPSDIKSKRPVVGSIISPWTGTSGTMSG